VAVGEAQFPSRSTVRRQLIRGDGFWMDALALQEFPKQFHRRMFVATALDRMADHVGWKPVAFVGNRSQRRPPLWRQPLVETV
jgi:hypothetical protein